MLQASLKVQVPILFLRLCKSLFWHHLQVGARVEVGNYYVEHRGGPLLPKAIGTYVCP